jgi:hypothetical protein
VPKFDPAVLKFDFVVMKFDFVVIKFDFGLIKFDLGVRKFDFVVVKFDFVVMKFDLAVSKFDLAVAPKDENQAARKARSRTLNANEDCLKSLTRSGRPRSATAPRSSADTHPSGTPWWPTNGQATFANSNTYTQYPRSSVPASDIRARFFPWPSS